jgi:hypothetical protein
MWVWVSSCCVSWMWTWPCYLMINVACSQLLAICLHVQAWVKARRCLEMLAGVCITQLLRAGELGACETRYIRTLLESCLLGYSTVQSVEGQPTFRSGHLPTSRRFSVYGLHHVLSQKIRKRAKHSVALSPQANYTDWATITCPRNLVPTFVDREVSRGQRGGSPTVVNLSFLDRSR